MRLRLLMLAAEEDISIPKNGKVDYDECND